MRSAMIACTWCALPLDGAARWVRLVSVEPEVVECGGERIELGTVDMSLRCPRCGEATSVPRDLPLAAA
jgi:predicted RNA-binding Zn-ribbon protein involved in translation (DUF1610 family)